MLTLQDSYLESCGSQAPTGMDSSPCTVQLSQFVDALQNKSVSNGSTSISSGSKRFSEPGNCTVKCKGNLKLSQESNLSRRYTGIDMLILTSGVR